MTYNRKLWGYPATLSVVAMAYESDLFGNQNSIFGLPDVPLPPVTLDVPQFEKLLNDTGGSLDPETSDSYLLVLMAAYGGLPLDYRSTPPKVNFTDPATLKAIRTVLDFAKQEKMLYFQLYYELPGGRGGGTSNSAAHIIWFDGLSEFPLNNTVLGNLPTGKFSAVSYDVGALYISSKTAYPEACYRWITTVAQHPELFTGMPARTRLLDNQGLRALLGPRAVSFAKAYSRIANQPATILIPPDGSLIIDYPLRKWLDEAFDGYVLHNQPLETALKKAQDFATLYQTCLVDSGVDLADRPGTYSKVKACLIMADPREAQDYIYQ